MLGQSWAYRRVRWRSGGELPETPLDCAFAGLRDFDGGCVIRNAGGFQQDGVRACRESMRGDIAMKLSIEKISAESGSEVMVRKPQPSW